MDTILFMESQLYKKLILDPTIVYMQLNELWFTDLYYICYLLLKQMFAVTSLN